MSDTENNLPSPSKEEESAMETTNNDETEKKETQNEIVPNVDSPPPSEPNTPSKSPEDSASKAKKGKAIGYVSDSDEELPMGLLERPVIITSGKRERKKTDRLPVGDGFGSGQKKKIDIPDGKGEKLGNIAIIEFRINQHKADDLKVLHRVLFSRIGTANEIKKNIRLFTGFPFEEDDKEYTKRMAVLNRATLPQIKQMCTVLDLEKKGTKLEIVTRLMVFLMKPTDSGKAVPKPKKKRSKTSGEKRKRTKKESKASKAKSKEDVSDDDEDDDDNDDDDDVKDTTLEDDDSSQEDNVDGESESEKEEAKPPKKKRRTESPKPQKSKSEKPKVDKTKAEKTKAEKPKPKPKKEKKEKENGKKEKTKAKVTKGSDDSSDDEPLSKSISDPPGNDEIKKVIEKILDGADLEEVTMKTVVKQVYAKYPKFDLSDKKEFIKCTVKEIISFND